jgi:hypothetical protein
LGGKYEKGKEKMRNIKIKKKGERKIMKGGQKRKWEVKGLNKCKMGMIV